MIVLNIIHIIQVARTELIPKSMDSISNALLQKLCPVRLYLKSYVCFIYLISNLQEIFSVVTLLVMKIYRYHVHSSFRSVLDFRHPDILTFVAFLSFLIKCFSIIIENPCQSSLRQLMICGGHSIFFHCSNYYWQTPVQ